MADKNENKKSYVYQLAIDNIEENQNAEYSRFKIIDITLLYGKAGFNKLTEAVNFTGQFKNYSELYLKLLQLGLVDKDDLGKPFTFVHRIKNKTKIDAIGTKRFPYNNRVLFKDQLSMLSYPDKQALKEEYVAWKDDKELDLDKQRTISINITKRLLKCNIPMIDGVFNIEKATQKEKLYKLFLDTFHNEIQIKVNKMKLMGPYIEYDNYLKTLKLPGGVVNENGAKYRCFFENVNLIESYNLTLGQYLDEKPITKKNLNELIEDYFKTPIRNIVHRLVFYKDLKKETYEVNYQNLFELSTFCICFFDYYLGRFYKEVELLIEDLCKKNEDTDEIVQYDMFGNGYTLKDLENIEKMKRKRSNTEKKLVKKLKEDK